MVFSAAMNPSFAAYPLRIATSINNSSAAGDEMIPLRISSRIQNPGDVEAIIAMILTLQGNIENADHSTLVMTGHYGTEWNKSKDLQVEGLRQFSGCHEWATGLFLFHLDGPTRPVEQSIRKRRERHVID